MGTKKSKTKKETSKGASGASVITSVGNVKVDAEVGYQTLIKGMRGLFGSVTQFELPSGTYTASDLIAQFQARIDAAETTKASNTAWRADVAAERAIAGQTDPVRAEMKQFAIARLGKTNPKLKQLGFAPKKVKPIPVATKMAAQTKAQATRAKKSGNAQASSGGTAAKTSTT